MDSSKYVITNICDLQDVYILFDVYINPFMLEIGGGALLFTSKENISERNERMFSI